MRPCSFISAERCTLVVPEMTVGSTEAAAVPWPEDDKYGGRKHLGFEYSYSARTPRPIGYATLSYVEGPGQHCILVIRFKGNVSSHIFGLREACTIYR